MSRHYRTSTLAVAEGHTAAEAVLTYGTWRIHGTTRTADSANQSGDPGDNPCATVFVVQRTA